MNKIINNQKECSKCHVIKNLDEFVKNKKNKCGRAASCKKCTNNYAKKYYKENNEILRKKYRKRWENYSKRDYVKKKTSIKNKNYWINNKEKITKKEKSSPKRQIDNRMRTAINISLKKNKKRRKWEFLVGYSCEELKNHLESLFTENMTWERFLNGEIHIDHIIPKSFFKYNSVEEENFKKCWSLKNLRPEWASKNISKSDFLPDGIRVRDLPL